MKINIFIAVKYCCILHRRVSVMNIDKNTKNKRKEVMIVPESPPKYDQKQTSKPAIGRFKAMI